MATLPLHVRISERLAREIQAGLLADGTRLPPERTMAAERGVSVGTLRKALADLEEKGLLTRVHGSGNYVKRSATAQTLYSFFRLERLGGGGLPTAEVLGFDTAPKPSQAPDIGGSAEGLRVRRLRRLDGEAASLEEIWMDAETANGLTKEDASDSLYQAYRDRLGLVIVSVADIVGVGAPPDWRPPDFTSPFGVWGHVERVSVDQAGRAVEWSRTWFDPARARYVSRSSA